MAITGGNGRYFLDLWEGLSHAQVVQLMKSLPKTQENPVLERLKETANHCHKSGKKKETEFTKYPQDTNQSFNDPLGFGSGPCIARRYPEVLEKMNGTGSNYPII